MAHTPAIYDPLRVPTDVLAPLLEVWWSLEPHDQQIVLDAYDVAPHTDQEKRAWLSIFTTARAHARDKTPVTLAQFLRSVLDYALQTRKTKRTRMQQREASHASA